MKYKYTGTKKELANRGFKEWRNIFMVKQIVNDVYIHIADNGDIQRGHHVYHNFKSKNDWLCDSYGMPIQKLDIQDLIDDRLVEVQND